MPLRDESIPEEQTQRPLRRLFLLYHEIRPGESRYSYAIESGMFERHADIFVQMREAESCGLWPEVTFDDGHRSNVEIAAPILQARGLTARFFITAGWTGRRRAIWAGRRCGRCMRRGFDWRAWMVAQAADTLRRRGVAD